LRRDLSERLERSQGCDTEHQERCKNRAPFRLLRVFDLHYAILVYVALDTSGVIRMPGPEDSVQLERRARQGRVLVALEREAELAYQPEHRPVHGEDVAVEAFHRAPARDVD